MKPQQDIVATLALAIALGLVPAAARAQEPVPAPAPNVASTKDSPTAKRQKALLKGIKLTPDQQAKADSLKVQYDRQLSVTVRIGVDDLQALGSLPHAAGLSDRGAYENGVRESRHRAARRPQPRAAESVRQESRGAAPAARGVSRIA